MSEIYRREKLGEIMITLKSTKEGLEFWITDGDSYSNIKKELMSTLGANRDFYRGTHLPANFFGWEFTDLQKRELSAFLNREYGIYHVHFSDDQSRQEPERLHQPRRREAPGAAEEEPPRRAVSVAAEQEAAEERAGGSLFLPGTIRSGQRIECQGDLVIVGDVNPGAEVIATGNIAVFGKLRGLAHAGATGRTDVLIVASYLVPQQIRIAGKIAIIPGNRRIDGPEVVKILDGKIVVDSLA